MLIVGDRLLLAEAAGLSLRNGLWGSVTTSLSPTIAIGFGLLVGPIMTASPEIQVIIETRISKECSDLLLRSYYEFDLCSDTVAVFQSSQIRVGLAAGAIRISPWDLN